MTIGINKALSIPIFVYNYVSLSSVSFMMHAKMLFKIFKNPLHEACVALNGKSFGIMCVNIVTKRRCEMY